MKFIQKQWIPFISIFHHLCWYEGAKNIWANTFIGSWVTRLLLPSRVVALSTTLTFPSKMPLMLGLGDWKFICGGIVPCLAIRTHFTKLANPANKKYIITFLGMNTVCFQCFHCEIIYSIFTCCGLTVTHTGFDRSNQQWFLSVFAQGLTNTSYFHWISCL